MSGSKSNVSVAAENAAEGYTVPGLTYDLRCNEARFVASEQLAQSRRIAMQEASYFAERRPMELDGCHSGLMTIPR